MVYANVSNQSQPSFRAATSILRRSEYRQGQLVGLPQDLDHSSSRKVKARHDFPVCPEGILAKFYQVRKSHRRSNGRTCQILQLLFESLGIRFYARRDFERELAGTCAGMCSFVVCSTSREMRGSCVYQL